MTTEIEAMESVRALIRHVGENPDREGLVDTPRRVVRALDELTSGYGVDVDASLGVDFECDGYDEMILVRDIRFYSLCEHHLLAFAGVAHVAYVPDGRVLGLSKIARAVDAFARRFQIQEKLTMQVADAVERACKPKGVGVVVQAEHLCMACRGVQKPGAKMVTSCLRGCFMEGPARAEFLQLIAT